LCEGEAYQGNKVYAFNGLEMGAWREAYDRRDNLWLIFSAAKKKMSYVFGYLTGHKEINWDWPSKLSFTTTTTVTRLVEEKPRGLAAIFSKPKLVEKVEEVEEWSEQEEISSSQIEIKIDEEKQVLQEKIFAATPSLSEFVQDGWNRLKKSETILQPDTREAKQFIINTPTDPEKPRKMNIDGEDVELLGPIKISLVPDMVQVFCSEEEAVKKETLPSSGSGAKWSSVPVSSYVSNLSKQNLRI